MKGLRLLTKFNLTNKVIVYVRDEGVNLNSKLPSLLLCLVSCCNYLNHLVAFILVML